MCWPATAVVTIRFTEQPGAYRLRGQKQATPLVRGFAVNLSGDTSDLARLPRERLDEILGRGRYQIAKSKDEINRAVGNDRIGSEFYPLLVTLLACLSSASSTFWQTGFTGGMTRPHNPYCPQATFWRWPHSGRSNYLDLAR